MKNPLRDTSIVRETAFALSLQTGDLAMALEHIERPRKWWERLRVKRTRTETGWRVVVEQVPASELPETVWDVPPGTTITREPDGRVTVELPPESKQ